ncbi:MAG TPA: polysaccharide pyruvyl transferase family protein [Rhodocyclaceae bacterium]|nr:polysaccharide pyruvyl transferase family protein [Rhodocyclaceae bacterium]
MQNPTSPANAIRTLHIASFQGNLGDSAMHDGAYRTRAEDCPLPFAYTQQEVREFFHWGNRRFDEAFIHHLNTFDLAIFGGMVGYELWRNDTVSGMRFDIAPELLDKVRIPVVFYGLGCDATRGMMQAPTRDKCQRFLDAAYRRGILLSLRNDGSRQILEENLGVDYVAPMPVIPDCGLFAHPAPVRTAMLYPAQKLVAINLAGDIPDIRFSTAGNEEAFARKICEISCALLDAEADVRVVFVPHVHADLSLIVKVLERMPDKHRRLHVSVAPYLTGCGNWPEIFDIYRQAHLVIGMRFHACVVAIGQGTPTLGIATHHKVSGFFESMDLPGSCISPNGEAWAERLIEQAFDMLANTERQREQIISRHTQHRLALKQFHERMTAWHINFAG